MKSSKKEKTEIRKLTEEFATLQRELKGCSKNQLIKLLLDLNDSAINYVQIIKQLNKEIETLKGEKNEDATASTNA